MQDIGQGEGLDPNGISLQEAYRKIGPDLRLVKVKDLEPGTGPRVLLKASVDFPDAQYALDIPIRSKPGQSQEIIVPGQFTGIPGAYTVLVSYTVPDRAVFYLQDLTMYGSPGLNVLWQLTIAGTQLFTGARLTVPYTRQFIGDEGRGRKLIAGQTILVEVHTTGGAISADGVIAGERVG